MFNQLTDGTLRLQGELYQLMQQKRFLSVACQSPAPGS
ncbi:hypothetical protein LDO05_05260 [Paenibacillus sp. YPG26]|nr:hypothetical protein LDO05_05260 [Paenibacillus sp. YPG26]